MISGGVYWAQYKDKEIEWVHFQPDRCLYQIKLQLF